MTAASAPREAVEAMGRSGWEAGREAAARKLDEIAAVWEESREHTETAACCAHRRADAVVLQNWRDCTRDAAAAIRALPVPAPSGPASWEEGARAMWSRILSVAQGQLESCAPACSQGECWVCDVVRVGEQREASPEPVCNDCHGWTRCAAHAGPGQATAGETQEEPIARLKLKVEQYARWLDEVIPAHEHDHADLTRLPQTLLTLKAAANTALGQRDAAEQEVVRLREENAALRARMRSNEPSGRVTRGEQREGAPPGGGSTDA